MASTKQASKSAFDTTIHFLEKKKNILFLTTSNRWSDEKWWEIPKSSLLAIKMQKILWEEKVTIIDIPKLKIYPCEGNISTARGNTCWLIEAKLNDKEKNPSWNHRCWASINNPDDELWKVSKALLNSDTVVFFWSVRRGQFNAFYQKLIERLTWLENRCSTLWEENILGRIDAGVIIINQNWRGKEVLKTQKKVLDFFGFNTPIELSWNWQYLDNSKEESNEAYKRAFIDFKKTFLDN